MSARVLIIGLDGADGDFLKQRISCGDCPNISGLLESFGYKRITRSARWGDDAVWTSFATGLSPDHHGRYHGPYQLLPGTYREVSFDERPQQDLTFWAELAREGHRCAVLDVPKCPLAGDMGQGFQISDWLAHAPDRASPCASPRALAADVVARFGARPASPCSTYKVIRGVPYHDGFPDDEAKGWVSQLLTSVSMKEAAAAHYLDASQWDLFLCVFKEAHCAGHLFWDDADIGHPDHDRRRNDRRGRPLDVVYRRLDEAVGRLVRLAGEGAQVVLFSPHGMRPNHSVTPLAERFVWKLNDLLLAQRSSRMGWLPDKVDKLLRRLRPAPGRSLLFVVPYNELGLAIRLNLCGREPYGLISRDERGEILRRAREFFLDLHDAETGEPVVAEVRDLQAECHGAKVEALPDLLVIWRNTKPVRELVSSTFGTLSEPTGALRPGNHDAEGFYFASGENAKQALGDDVVMEDFAKTLVSLVRNASSAGKAVRQGEYQKEIVS